MEQVASTYLNLRAREDQITKYVEATCFKQHTIFLCKIKLQCAEHS
jgi:hypothetical protein